MWSDLAAAGAKMAAFTEMKVRRCLWCGDVDGCGQRGEGGVVCREAGVVGVMEGRWSEAVVESDVGGGPK